MMKIRFASALLALALPVLAQDPTATDAEVLFYKAYYLEKGPKDHAAAMELYQKFLDKAPEHKLAAEAAKQQYRLLDQTGKSKERDAFKAKYEKLLGNIQPAPAGGDVARGGGARGEGARGEGGGRPDMQARIAELEKQLEKAKADGNAEEVKRLEQALERARQGGRGQGGPGGRGGVMRLLGSDKALKDMSAEEIGQIKEGLAGASSMVDRIRDMGNEEMADKLEGGIAALQKALDGNDMEAAQKAVDELKKVMPQGGRGRPGQGGRPGEGGGQGGRPGQGGQPGGQGGGRGGER
ncbi:MAG: hypothetical protein JNL12_18670 [Planctomycetes bacterium]|nr:hypothetical protein [Planctomycetota bacterium]